MSVIPKPSRIFFFCERSRVREGSCSVHRRAREWIVTAPSQRESRGLAPDYLACTILHINTDRKRFSTTRCCYRLLVLGLVRFLLQEYAHSLHAAGAGGQRRSGYLAA